MGKRITAPVAAAVVALLVAATAVLGATLRSAPNGAIEPSPSPVACTDEAMICPDGSAVGRKGPECRFDPCPLEQGAGVVRGHVSIGPLDPVETPGGSPATIPPDVYASRWIVFTGESGRYVKTAPINPEDGTYAAWLWPGTYVVDINHAGIDIAKDLPREITVTEGRDTVLDVDIDTGIR